ncbi:MAG: hypothetical protein NW214_13005 [Pseudanabaenaceae cyanobacterium bins.39]|nr:hypothetical protein [Pseudanabaenaceae cyanobacterium bins.39]
MAMLEEKQNQRRSHHMLKYCLGLGLMAIAMQIPIKPLNAQVTVTVPQQPVQPSLWWKLERLPVGWVENIRLDQESQQAIITINPNRWGTSDYLNRFSFLFKLGTEAQRQNFNLLLLDRRSQKLAEYSLNTSLWQITPQYLGAEPFRFNSSIIAQPRY